MSRRRRRVAPHSPAAQAPLATDVRGSALLSRTTLAHLVLFAGTYLLVSLAGGTPGDRPPITIAMPGDPQPAGLLELVETPIALILAALVFARTFSGGRFELRKNAPFSVRAVSALALLLLAWCGASAFTAEYRDPALHMVALIAASVMFGLAAGKLGGEAVPRQWLLGVQVGVPSLVCIIGLNEYIRNAVGGNPGWRVFATFANQDFLAGYLLFSIPVALALVLTADRRHIVFAAATALLLQLACLLLTQSRLGLASLLAALVFFALVGVAVLRKGPCPTWMRRRALAVGLVALLLTAAASGPVVRRIRLASAESYSATFRLLTWQGTAAMAQAHPVLGTGIGTFATSYPRYARVGYTAHAHNTYLQLAGEAGYPSALLLGALLLAAVATGLRGLRAGGTEGLLTAGLVSGLVGALFHNVTDSDLYVPANMLALALTIGLLAGSFSRSVSVVESAPEMSEHRPARRLASLHRAVVLLASMALAAHAILVASGRMEARRSEASLAAGDGTAALTAARAAVGFDGDNADYHLRLAHLYELSGQPAAAERAYLAALGCGTVGRAARLYGRFLAREGRLDQAVAMHMQAVRWEPLNLQSLLALAQAQQSAGRLREAEETYARLAGLYDQPVAKVRAIPELVETEYAEAFLALADYALGRGDTRKAESHLRRACEILEAFRQSTRLQISEIRVSADRKRTLFDRYESALERWATVLGRLGLQADRAAALERLRSLRAERSEEAGPAGNR